MGKRQVWRAGHRLLLLAEKIQAPPAPNVVQHLGQPVDNDIQKAADDQPEQSYTTV